MILLLLLLGSCAAENVQLTVNSNYINYVAEIVDRTFIAGYGPTLVGKEMPGAEGTLYKIGGLVMNKIDLGFSSGELHEGYMTLSLNNATGLNLIKFFLSFAPPQCYYILFINGKTRTY